MLASHMWFISAHIFFQNVIIFTEENNILAPRQIKREGTKCFLCCHKSLKTCLLRTFFHMKERKTAFQLEQDQILFSRIALR